MDSSATLLTSYAIFSGSFLLLMAGVTWLLVWMVRTHRQEMKELSQSFLSEISTTRAQQQQSLDQVFTGLITGNPQEYAAMRQAKIQEAAQLQWLSTVEYAETQKARAEEDAERQRADAVAIQKQMEQEQEELDASIAAVYGGIA